MVSYLFDPSGPNAIKQEGVGRCALQVSKRPLASIKYSHCNIRRVVVAVLAGAVFAGELQQAVLRAGELTYRHDLISMQL